MYAVVLGSSNGRVASVKVDVLVGMNTVVTRGNIDLSCIDVNSVVRDDAFAGRCYFDAACIG